MLNLGLNSKSVMELARLTNNERFAWDSYRRFIQMYGDVVMGIGAIFEPELRALKERRKIKFDTEMTVADLKELVDRYKTAVSQKGKVFPEDAMTQLVESTDAVFRSWDTPRAVIYRTQNGIPHNLGTAVNIQMMVFGNMGEDSGTGVGFTRSPITGNKEVYGEYLANAQGEDVVAGIRNPEPVQTMKNRWPKLYDELAKAFNTLELHYREMQDIEFTIERGILYLLQTRTGKRTAQAAVKIAVDMFQEKLMTKEQALLSVDPTQLDQLLHKQFDPQSKKKGTLLGKGLAASPGAAVGVCAFSPEEAVKLKENNLPVVLIRDETTPEDIQGMLVSRGVLTRRGGMTSHAAVVARGMGLPCISACEDMLLSSDSMTLGKHTFKSGDMISLDGSTGEVFAGKIEMRDPELGGDYETFMGWADAYRSLEIRTNADTPQDASKAVSFGAQGIGLVRTEHMFFAEDRINLMRTMILAKDKNDRQPVLQKLLPFQQADFEGIFQAMDGKPVVIRLLDPPFHEFLPHHEEEIQAVANLVPSATVKSIKDRIKALAEANPMLGFRGCRLGIMFPEITEMQVQAIFQAALKVKAKGITALPEIEVPLVGNVDEFLPFKTLVNNVAEKTSAKGKIKYSVGTMIEVPRAALCANELAKECDFFSFGTNDLTQMTCGFSRDDAGKFLVDYVLRGIYERDPFQAIDTNGVGKMMQLCVSLARAVNPNLDIGICGEHGGEPSSIEFCHRIGLNNVSCSPFRVPIARLAAAQAQIKYGPPPKRIELAQVFSSKL